MTSRLRHVGPQHGSAAAAPFRLLLRHAALIRLLAARELRDRYAGSALGIGWALVQPLLLFVVYLSVFGFLVRFAAGGTAALPTDYGHYLLAGFTPWYALIASLQAAVAVVRLNAGLVKQIEFPVAVLPVKTVLAQAPLLLLGLGIALGYQAIRFGHLPPTLLLLPVLLLLYAMLVLGLAWLLAAIGTYVSDLDPIVASLSMVALYVLPMFFLPGATPEALQPFITLNPFSPVVLAFQDVLVFGELRQPGAWIFLAGFAGVSFFGGYAVFAWLRPAFGDVL